MILKAKKEITVRFLNTNKLIASKIAIDEDLEKWLVEDKGFRTVSSETSFDLERNLWVIKIITKEYEREETDPY